MILSTKEIQVLRKEIGSRIAKRRAEAELSQDIVAGGLDKTTMTIYNWESGKTLPDILELIAFTKILAGAGKPTTISYFALETDSPTWERIVAGSEQKSAEGGKRGGLESSSSSLSSKTSKGVHYRTAGGMSISPEDEQTVQELLHEMELEAERQRSIERQLEITRKVNELRNRG